MVVILSHFVHISGLLYNHQMKQASDTNKKLFFITNAVSYVNMANADIAYSTPSQRIRFNPFTYIIFIPIP